MSKVVLINGSPNAEGCTFTALSEVAGALNANGVETEMVWIGKSPLQAALPVGNTLRQANVYSMTV